MKAITTLPAQTPAVSIPYGDLERMATAIAHSRLFGVQDPNQAIALCLIAQAEGLHPAIAARDFHIIQGRPAKTAEAIHRAFLAAGGKIEWHQLDDTLADATFTHPAGGTFRCVWDLNRAKVAGLGGKEMWKKYPRAMLRARCISEGCRTVYPGATSGMYTPEEVDDMPEREVNGTVVSMIRDDRPAPAEPPPSDPPIGKNSAAKRALEARIGELELNRDGVKTWCQRYWKVEHFQDLTHEQQQQLMQELPKMAFRKLHKQIERMSAPELEGLCKTPPAWLQGADLEAVLNQADARVQAIAAALEASTTPSEETTA